MKKRYTLFSKASLICVIVLFTLFNCQKERNATSALMDSRIVPEYFARQVAEKFDGEQFFKNSSDTLKKAFISDTRMITPPRLREIKNSYTFFDKNKKPAIYLFNYIQGGFVFVSAEYTLQPILAYVPIGEAKRDTVPAGFIMWVQKTIENVEIVRDGLYDNSRIGKAAWKQYIKQHGLTLTSDIEMALKSLPISRTKTGPSSIIIEPEEDCDADWIITNKGPFLPVNWGQGKSYNNLINPNVNYGCSQTGNDRPWTGCVATAMAQVIRYWKSSPLYDYNSMPNSSGNIEVQKLMFDAGKYVDMHWDCDGSWALSGHIPDALKSHFNFSSANKITNSINIYNKTVDNLKKGWPVLLGGCRDKIDLGFFLIGLNCHEWVCDGFSEYISPCDGIYQYFHINWGWHEEGASTDLNGWFGFFYWNTPGRYYRYAYDAIVDIHP